MLTVDVTDPGRFAPGQRVTHHLVFRNLTGQTIYLDPAPYDQTTSDGIGRLVTAGRGCGPYYDSQADRVDVGCRLAYQPLEIPAGGSAAEPITIYTDPEEAGPVPLLPGTYTLEQALRWHREPDPNTPLLGTATVRITYRVEATG
ncbi:MAG TPA: hypothetical protein VG452_11010 [Egibacteraceae bacterium]|nr:hypothetical protein [Egibacteraceae bacterium]